MLKNFALHFSSCITDSVSLKIRHFFMFVIHKTSNLLHVLNLAVNPPSLLLVLISTRGARIVFNGFLACLVMRLRRAQDRFYVKTDSLFK